MMSDVWNIGKCCDVIGIEHRFQIISKLEISTSPLQFFHILYMFLIVEMCFLYYTISCCCIVTVAMSRSLERQYNIPC